jgi:hypothetical protein
MAGKKIRKQGVGVLSFCPTFFARICLNLPNEFVISAAGHRFCSAASGPMSTLLKLNLGCGENHVPGFVNVDKYGRPDLVHDLETFPWPWPDNSVGEFLFNHVMEHLGRTVEVYRDIFKEIYRVGAPGARVHINVPHPRHDSFLNDPTHVRAVTPAGLELFSKEKNRQWAAQRAANSPLGLYWDIDFRLVHTNYALEAIWVQKLERKEITREELFEAVLRHNNVVQDIQMILEVVK